MHLGMRKSLVAHAHSVIDVRFFSLGVILRTIIYTNCAVPCCNVSGSIAHPACQRSLEHEGNSYAMQNPTLVIAYASLTCGQAAPQLNHGMHLFSEGHSQCMVDGK